VHISFVTIGENIRKYRKAKGLTQTELAEKLGTTQFVITNYERGRNNPTAAKLPEIAKALGVGLDQLYGLKGDDPKAEEKEGSGKRREAQIQKIFRELPPAKQRAVLEHAKGLKKS
jgi:transcriptional regulator with XRE-family HTH domain